jgi:hypothetical protein
VLADIAGRPVAKEVTTETDAAPPQADVYTLVVEAPEPLRSVLEMHLDRARFRDARVAGAVTPLELDRLIATAPAQARSLAETEGYFNARVTATRDRAEVPRVVVTVVPGPQVLVGEVGITFAGPLSEARQAGDAAATGTATMLIERWPLARGMPFTQASWASAKSSTLARLHAQGYPLAHWQSTAAEVDPATQRVALGLVADSGPLFRVGSLRIVGLSRYAQSAVDNLLDFKPGEVYSEALLAQWQRHLQKSELFEAAVVELQVDPEHADAAIVTVTLREMTRFLLTLDQAVDTVFAAITGGLRGETYIPRAPSARVVDIVEVLIDGRDIPVTITGIRPGEKIHEIMVSEEECYRTVDRGDYYAICPMLPELAPAHGDCRVLDGEYSSERVTLDQAGLRALLAPYAAQDAAEVAA